MSLAPGQVVLALAFVIDVDGELRDERFHWFEGVFQVREGREGGQVVGLRCESFTLRAPGSDLGGADAAISSRSRQS